MATQFDAPLPGRWRFLCWMTMDNLQPQNCTAACMSQALAGASFPSLSVHLMVIVLQLPKIMSHCFSARTHAQWPFSYKMVSILPVIFGLYVGRCNTNEPRLIPNWPVIQRWENNIKYTNFSLLHDRLGHREIRTLLAADEYRVWHDTWIRMDPETDCVTCQIATIRATSRNKNPRTPAGHPGAIVFMDILPCKSSPGLTPRTSHAYCLILVDSYSRFSV